MFKGTAICCLVFGLSQLLGAEKYRIFKLPRDAIIKADNRNITKGEATNFNGLEVKFFISTEIIQNMMTVKGTTTTVAPVVTGTETGTGGTTGTLTNTGTGIGTGTGTGTGIGTGTGTSTGGTGNSRFANPLFYRNFRPLVKGEKAGRGKYLSEQQQRNPVHHQMPYPRRTVNDKSNRKQYHRNY